MQASIVTLPYCTAVQLEPWSGTPRRFFAGYRRAGACRWLLGHAVLDEFGTVSSPVLLTPAPLVGKVYDAGIVLGHRWDAELPIDAGWPPLVVGLDLPAPELAPGWQEELLAALAAPAVEPAPGAPRFETLDGGPWSLQRLRMPGAALLATDAPLLPKQLRRLAETAAEPFALAWSTGNRVTRSTDGTPATFRALSEAGLEKLLAAAGAA